MGKRDRASGKKTREQNGWMMGMEASDYNIAQYSSKTKIQSIFNDLHALQYGLLSMLIVLLHFISYFI